MSSQSIEYKSFKLIKAWEDRIKARTPVLKGEPERAYIFQVLLNKRPEIKELLITVKTGEIDIKFDSSNLPKASLLTAMDAILANVAKKAACIDKKQLPGTPHEIKLLVEGMSCPACALLIEMALKKDEQIVDANVNLETKEVVVYGTLTIQQIVEKVEKLGYKQVIGQQ